jgi:DNA-directed RNA polymerase specialized sigma24 family protein
MLFQTLVKLGIEQGLSAAEIAAKFNLPLTDVEILLNSL